MLPSLKASVRNMAASLNISMGLSSRGLGTLRLWARGGIAEGVFVPPYPGLFKLMLSIILRAATSPSHGPRSFAAPASGRKPLWSTRFTSVLDRLSCRPLPVSLRRPGIELQMTTR
ncbi:hypothetical protein N7509_011454 [Penicillium cosmopolitanum]|uniref:Uncharacterized protein n=1 Tax=Penicillium cosmopolitanum TaxID=1131564 RepID=A0A9W9VT94_9EURO|nr:uncharacterized protein N7509_011454 [Penicillium cosmopolitanum]KAJ5388913.1 hypothetical protein N7509_011454 [Penicillium cosmopolitanum]